MLGVWSAGEVLTDQLGQEQECAPGPVVADDVLSLAGGVAGDHGVVADDLAGDPGGVVLEETVLAVGAGEVELLHVIERADSDEHGPRCLGALHGAVDHRALQGDVVGQVVQPGRVVVGEGGIAAAQIRRRGFLGGLVALTDMVFSFTGQTVLLRHKMRASSPVAPVGPWSPGLTRDPRARRTSSSEKLRQQPIDRRRST